MLVTLQIVKFFADKMNLNENEVFQELAWIVDNHTSDYLDLTEKQCLEVTKIYNNDTKLKFCLDYAFNK